MRTKPHSRPAKRGSGAAGTGGGCAASPGAASHNAAPSSARLATATARILMSPARGTTNRVEEQFLCALEARRDLQRRERFLLRVRAVAGEQIAFAEIAVRRGLVGRARLQRSPELARRHGQVAFLERHAPPRGVRG